MFDTCGNMSVYKHFAVKDKLFHQTGLLSLLLSSPAFVTANEDVNKVMNSEKEKTTNYCKRGKFADYFPAIKIELANCAA